MSEAQPDAAQTPARWRRIENLFHELLEMPLSEREAHLLSACGNDDALLSEVRGLLAHDTATGDLADAVQSEMAAIPARTALQQAGPYELLEEIGRGGMGTVYKARRADKAYDATVAVKLVRPGMDTDFVLGRFRQERQTLARLTHPNIARLLDGGTTAEGVPYIVMEYIDGPRITGYCRREKLNLEQKLRLMLPVCLATDYAHRNFVVHRDIKPGNILVDSTGTPKLLDFGICKLLHANPLDSELTITQGLGMMTPDYASPEQVLGEAISARSDVYSLGVVLYELLTGVRPHKFDKKSLLAIEEAICHTPVKPPSSAVQDSLSKALQGDLDNILMRALEKDPQRRYESAFALAMDLRRYLDHEPVTARAAGPMYRAGKFVRRHRVLTAAVAAVLTASTIGTMVSLRQMQRAEAREKQIRSLAKVFMYDVHDSVRDLPGATAARQKIVQTAVEYLDALAGSKPNDPDLLKELAAGYQRVADVQGSDSRGANLGQSRASLASYSKAIGFWDRYTKAVPTDRAGLIERLNTLRRSADLEALLDGDAKALTTYGRAEAGARALAEQFPSDEKLQALLADVLTVAGRRYRDAGELKTSLVKNEEALVITRRLADLVPRDSDRQTAVASAESAVGMTKARLGDLAAAMKLYESSARRGELMVATDPNNVSRKRNLMLAYSHLGDILGYPDLPNLGETAKAEAVYAKMVALAREIQAGDPKDARAATDSAIALLRWAMVLTDPASREQRLKEAAELIHARLEASPANLTLLTYDALVAFQLGLISESSGRRAAALAHWRRVIDIATPNLGKRNEAMLRVMTMAMRELTRCEPLDDLRRNGAARAAFALAQSEQAARAQDAGNVSAQVVVARSFGIHAVYHARLGEKGPAENWRKRALDLWKDLATRAGFQPGFRRELEEFERWRP
jgi:eukaryotic-like serine/threonine-protein kinase